MHVVKLGVVIYCVEGANHCWVFPSVLQRRRWWRKSVMVCNQISSNQV